MNIIEARRLGNSAIKQLAEELDRGKSEALEKYLAAMGRFARYSLRNALLIAQQRPDASRVAGFGTWKRLGRWVRKGERGIMILAPIVRREQVNNEQGTQVGTCRTEPGIDPDPEEEIRAFKAAYVFDVSQTEGRPLPEPAQIHGDPGPHLAKLYALVGAKGVVVRYEKHLSGADGVSNGGTIVLRAGLNPAAEFSTLVHELAHEELHHDKVKRGDRIRETEAEAVAHVVCHAIGLDVGSSSSDYIQLYDGRRETLVSSLKRIQRVATEIIVAVAPDPELQYGIRDRVPTAST